MLGHGQMCFDLGWKHWSGHQIMVSLHLELVFWHTISIHWCPRRKRNHKYNFEGQSYLIWYCYTWVTNVGLSLSLVNLRKYYVSYEEQVLGGIKFLSSDHCTTLAKVKILQEIHPSVTLTFQPELIRQPSAFDHLSRTLRQAIAA